MLTTAGAAIYGRDARLYKLTVPEDFTLGDVIRKTRERKKWNQTQLGERAEMFPIKGDEGKINKSTVSKVESEPYTSKLGTIWRLMAALGLTFADIEKQVGHPFREPSHEQRKASTKAPLSRRRNG